MKTLFFLSPLIALTTCSDKEPKEGFEGAWKMVAFEEEYYNGGSQTLPPEWDDQYWCFDSTSMVRLTYPRYCNDMRAYDYSFDSLNLTLITQDKDGEKGHTFASHPYKFVGDTLKILDIERSTSEILLRYCFVRADIDEDVLTNLRENFVDWSYYIDQWQFVDYMPKKNFELAFVCPIEKPDILDLEDETKVSFNKNFLTYEINGQKFEYTFVQGASDNMINLSPICPERRGMAFYKYRRIE